MGRIVSILGLAVLWQSSQEVLEMLNKPPPDETTRYKLTLISILILVGMVLASIMFLAERGHESLAVRVLDSIVLFWKGE